MTDSTSRRRRTRPLRPGDTLEPVVDRSAPAVPPPSAPPARPPVELPSIDQVVSAVPGMFRIGVSAAAHLTEWTVQNTVTNAVTAMKQVAAGEPTTKVVGDAMRRVRTQAGSLFGDLAGGGRELESGSGDDAYNPAADDGPGVDNLKRRGAELLRRSADVAATEDTHPAYVRIVDDLAPDEARILRLFYEDGAQPSVDVRAGGTLPITSDLVASGISMIGNLAGCRYPERVPRYLNNLQRLGLIWFSREPVSDVTAYQVLEAQPEVADTIAGVKRGKTVRRSIHLTPFGADFCEVCLPVGARHDADA